MSLQIPALINKKKKFFISLYKCAMFRENERGILKGFVKRSIKNIPKHHQHQEQQKQQ